MATHLIQSKREKEAPYAPMPANLGRGKGTKRPTDCDGFGKNGQIVYGGRLFMNEQELIDTFGYDPRHLLPDTAESLRHDHLVEECRKPIKVKPMSKIPDIIKCVSDIRGYMRMNLTAIAVAENIYLTRINGGEHWTLKVDRPGCAECVARLEAAQFIRDLTYARQTVRDLFIKAKIDFIEGGAVAVPEPIARPGDKTEIPQKLPNRLANLKKISRAINQAFICPTCGKSLMVKATAWRGRGTGQCGESHYDPAAFEAVTPETHCICPDGPVDMMLKARNHHSRPASKPPELGRVRNLSRRDHSSERGPIVRSDNALWHWQRGMYEAARRSFEHIADWERVEQPDTAQEAAAEKPEVIDFTNAVAALAEQKRQPAELGKVAQLPNLPASEQQIADYLADKAAQIPDNLKQKWAADLEKHHRPYLEQLVACAADITSSHLMMAIENLSPTAEFQDAMRLGNSYQLGHGIYIKRGQHGCNIHAPMPPERGERFGHMSQGIEVCNIRGGKYRPIGAMQFQGNIQRFVLEVLPQIDTRKEAAA